ncbi:hypothetical protein GGR52DRAFT_337828 [Hypoxylon sp. FL1284]|nr:hypothetical protein GGR52DRAFT_337828 [Hypoxylon sp. FL1284]
MGLPCLLMYACMHPLYALQEEPKRHPACIFTCDCRAKATDWLLVPLSAPICPYPASQPTSHLDYVCMWELQHVDRRQYHPRNASLGHSKKEKKRLYRWRVFRSSPHLWHCRPPAEVLGDGLRINGISVWLVSPARVVPLSSYHAFLTHEADVILVLTYLGALYDLASPNLDEDEVPLQIRSAACIDRFFSIVESDLSDWHMTNVYPYSHIHICVMVKLPLCILTPRFSNVGNVSLHIPPFTYHRLPCRPKAEKKKIRLESVHMMSKAHSYSLWCGRLHTD